MKTKLNKPAKVLILSFIDDKHAVIVAEHLQAMNVQTDFFRYDELITKYALNYSVRTGESNCFLQSSNETLDLNSYTSIWYRRPGSVRLPRSVESWIDKMIESECRAALNGMWHTLDCTWVNYPANDAAAMLKLGQLRVAEQLGFSIPKTIVTSQPQVVRQFYNECNGRVIYKMLSELSNMPFPSNERPPGIGTMVLREEDIPFLDQVIYSPHIFQERIDKAIELRVTVVGKRIFCISIDSQAGKGAIDWRNDYSVAMRPFELPAEVGQRCLAVMQSYGLNYGAFDLILDKDNNYVFIEINCAGQYLWAEKLAGVPISLAVAELLAGKEAPLIEK